MNRSCLYFNVRRYRFVTSKLKPISKPYYMERTAYLDERKALVSAMFEETKLFDRSILTLAAGSFGLSFAFIRQIVPAINPDTIILLKVSWGSFSISIIATLISLLTSIKACRKQIEILETHIKNGAKNKSYNNLSACTTCLNILSIVTFVLGVCCLAYFSISNLVS